MAQTIEIILRGYKKTEVGIIPENWEIKELSKVGNTYGGLSGKTINDFQEGKYPYIPFLNIMNNPIIDIHSFDYVNIRADEKQNKAIKGDLFFNGSSETPEEVGMCSVLLDDIQNLYLNSFCFGFRLNKNLNTDGVYLSYFFRSSIGRKLIFSLAQGATRYNLSKTSFMKLKIPYPNSEEQTAIARVLSDTDALIESLEKLIAKKKAIKQGAMQQLLAGKKRLPGFSGEWVMKTLGEIVDFSNGKAHENFISNDGEFIVVNSKFISSEGKVVKYSKQCLCPAPINSILFVMSDVPNGKAIAKCFLVDEYNKYTVNQRICALNPKINAKFLFYKANRNPYYLSFDDGVKQTNLRKEDVLGCKIYIPKDKSEQTAIANILSDMDTEIEKLEQKRDKYISLKQGMMQQLLTGKIRLVNNGDN